ncbi:hypothetical protein OKW34_000453 [Paraburkholderia youngii]
MRFYREGWCLRYSIEDPRPVTAATVFPDSITTLQRSELDAAEEDTASSV